MPKITKQNFLTNKFNRTNTNKILHILNDFVDSSTTANELITLLSQQADEFVWVVGSKPAYHIQYQVDSVAILRVNNFIILVWKPKYIQYPHMIQFPEIQNIKKESLKLQYDDKITTLNQGNKADLVDFLENFYGTFFKSDQNFQTNLVTYAKHFVSKKTSISYWHCIYDQQQKLALRNIDKMQSVVKIRVSGIKKGYNKCLLLFSCKGQREGVLHTLAKKWTQTLSFLAMVLIFISVVSCSPDETEGFCQYRSEAMVLGAGLMMSLFGLKLAKGKKKPALPKSKTN